MNNRLHTLESSQLQQLNDQHLKDLIVSLESGKPLYIPNHAFQLKKDEHQLLTDRLLPGSKKNISFDYQRQKLGQFQALPENQQTEELLAQFMSRYAEFAQGLIHTLLPHYTDQLIWGRTSYRPANVKGRQLSKRKDDSRLHVDAFPGTPVYGNRILRVFSNINPFNEPRVWHLGESFDTVLSKFATSLPAFSSFRSKLLYLIKATKKPRSAYDHYMIKMHDKMKLDDEYQTTVEKQRVEFPSHSNWIVFTDQVSHAALTGQYLLEQTFYLPVDAMADVEKSPLRQWERIEMVKMKG